MKPIRIAIIGFGKIAADQHLPSISANPRFELAATSSRSGQGPQPAFTDWQELLRSVKDLDAVAITTPPRPRYDIARECASAGLHCLLEKPPAATLAEIDDLTHLAEQQKVSLYTTWHARHHPAVEAAAAALAGKRIVAFEILWHEDVHKWHPGQQWVWDPGGFGVFDPGINAFSIATRIFPGPLFVRQADLSVPANGQTPIAAEVDFASPQADGRLHASLDWRKSEGEEWTIIARTADGQEVRLTSGGADLSIDGKPVATPGDPGEYPDIYARFADLIDERRSEVDIAPMRLVADCLLLGRTTRVDPITM
ncbi:Gfo/Idh/MocA family oxidoreductase [Sphingomonas sp.]|uniref:Gfo/Idh/MocA family protein n=1 Tax=Sphingomonas sp. TaxID=28214 RepID=UPI0025F7CEFA|nr:Gfo/Idh/MocA family oxidoreductase [Sphingomonas sp.]MBV9529095.1 Gfo/Idh/MocA family oxidoreductase [Sphingomonas sp.]